MSKKKIKIVNCYYKESRSGIGDFLRGSIYLRKICLSKGIDFDIDFQKHPINKYITTDCDYSYRKKDITCLPTICEKEQNSSNINFYELMTEKIENLFEKSLSSDNINYIFCNFSEIFKNKSLDLMPAINNYKMDKDCSYWFSDRLVFGEDVNNSVNKYLLEAGLKDFHVVHFRTGDNSSFFKNEEKENHFFKEWHPDEEYCFELCKKISLSLNGKPIIIMSDNNKIKKYIQKASSKSNLSIFVPHLESFHTQKNPSFKIKSSLKTEEDAFFYAAFDAKLISLSSSVRCFSVYFWGSGFSSWLAKIYNKPFFCKPFIKPIDIA